MDEQDAAGPSGRDQQPSGTAPFTMDTQDTFFEDVERSDFELLKRVSGAARWWPASSSRSGAPDTLLTPPRPLLLQALLNERMAPDILQYKEELVQRVKDSLDRKVRGRHCCSGSRSCCPAADTSDQPRPSVSWPMPYTGGGAAQHGIRQRL
jgi:hypothetical protein